MAIPSWIDSPFTWDTIIVGGQEFPGLATVDAGREYTCDKKQSAGADSVTLTGLGHMPAEVKITLRIWNTGQWNELQTRIAQLLPKPHKSKPQAVDVSHPALALYGIRSLYFTKIHGPRHTSVKHVMEVDLIGTEYLPVKTGENVTSTQKGSTADPSKVAVAPGLIDQAGKAADANNLAPVRDAVIAETNYANVPPPSITNIGP